VTRQRNGFFYDVVKSFYEMTGCPMIVNTSFNLRGEPIICDHRDAYHCFVMSDIDILVLGSCVVTKPKIDLDVPMTDPANQTSETLHA
jgi:carbamoyltransferase